MTALHTTLALETGTAWAPAMFVKAGPAARRATPVRAGRTARTERAATGKMLRSMALFLLAPFVGLVYAVLLPFVGLAMLAWFAWKAFVETGRLAATLEAARKVGLLAAAPFAALAYVIAMPFVGLGMLAWFGAHALLVARIR
jgi:hypothetical protein